ncbi:PQQ-binding-like beta-propeller repeat protein [Acidobacteriota bacterium]
MFCTPEVSGDLLFIGSCAGNFYALDKNTGLTKWVYDIKKDGKQTSFHGDMLFTEDLVIIGTDHTTGHVYAFEKKTGELRWKYPAGPGVAATAVRRGEKIYFPTLEDRLVCLNLKNGKETWSFPTGYSLHERPVWNHSPLVKKDTVFFGGLDGVVYARDADSGELKWKKELSDRVSTSFVIRGNYLYVGTRNGHIYKLDENSGAIEKEFKINVPGTISGEMTLTRNSIVFFVNWSKEGGEMLSVDLSLDRVLWRQKAPSGASWFTAKPFIFRDAILVGTEKGDIYAFRVTDGVNMWQHILRNETVRSFGSHEDILYIGTLQGNLYAAAVK